MDIISIIIVISLSLYFSWLVKREKEYKKKVSKTLIRIHDLRIVKILLLYFLLLSPQPWKGTIISVLVLIEILITGLFHKYIEEGEKNV